jgi:hypothetical protein
VPSGGRESLRVVYTLDPTVPRRQSHRVLVRGVSANCPQKPDVVQAVVTVK